MFHLLARPLLLHLAGASTHLPTHVSLPLANDVHLRGGRIDYRRARLQRDQHGRVCIEPLPAQGSAMLRTVVDADALIALGPGDIYRAGDLVDTVLLDALE
jgi:molybdopterin molybdotransferase